MAQSSTYERDRDGRPVKIILHDDHDHKGMKPHDHEIDLKKTTIADVSKGGNFHRIRAEGVQPCRHKKK